MDAYVVLVCFLLTGTNTELVAEDKWPSKLSFWSLRFGQFCHFSPNFKPFAILVPVVSVLCHFSLKVHSSQISQRRTCYFVLFSGATWSFKHYIYKLLYPPLSHYSLPSLFLSLPLSSFSNTTQKESEEGGFEEIEESKE
ncbi:hypothetical protein Hanom_Chr06g00481281 [Helianthus anomalus]